MKAPCDRPRIVLVPGFMGSVLKDHVLDEARHTEAVELCRGHVGDFLASPRLPIWLEGRELCAADADAAVLWGRLDMLHWVFDPADWQERLSQGNGYDDPGAVAVPRGVGGLFMAQGLLKWGYGREAYRFDFRPYQAITEVLPLIGYLLEPRKADVRIFPYDWRLSCAHNASRLARQIKQWWWQGRTPSRVHPTCKVVIVAHSLGGLIARYLIESDSMRGYDYIRQLITIGTPHMGLPESYTQLIGITRPFDFPGWFRNFVGRIRWLVDLVGAGGDADHDPTHLFPKSMQMSLCNFCASVIETLPAYDFACVRPGACATGKYQPFEETYTSRFGSAPAIGARRHPGPSGGPPVTLEWIRKTFRRGLIPPEDLDAWLGCHGVEYHLLAGQGFETIVACDRVKQAPIRSTVGDGVVPVMSATLGVAAGENTSVRVFGRDELDGNDHQGLCSAHGVQNYCAEHIHTPQDEPDERPIGPSAPRSSTSARPYAPLWRHVPRGLLSTDELNAKMKLICELQLDRCIRVAARKIAPVDDTGLKTGGLVLRQDPGATDIVHIVTWSTSPNALNETGNNSHAEEQLVKFLLSPELQPVSRSVLAIRINNVNLSPCSTCAGRLVQLLTRLNTEQRTAPHPSSGVKAVLSWSQLYLGVKRANGINRTFWHNVAELSDAGWQVHAPGRAHPTDEGGLRVEAGKRGMKPYPPKD
jgi:hypothetical protein